MNKLQKKLLDVPRDAKNGSKLMAQKVIFIVFNVFDLDLWRSFDFGEFTICSIAWLV